MQIMKFANIFIHNYIADTVYAADSYGDINRTVLIESAVLQRTRKLKGGIPWQIVNDIALTMTHSPRETCIGSRS